MDIPTLDLRGYGHVEAKIIWIEGKLLKIKFLHNGVARTEIFHFNEILNYNEIFIDKELNIKLLDEK